MNLNKVILGGRLTNQPELRVTTSGVSVCSFSIAINRPKRQGAETAEVDFIRCSAFRQTAELIARGFKKGNNILVCGSITQSRFTDRDGQKRESISVTVDEVTFIDPKEDTPSEFKPPVGKTENGVYNPYTKPEEAKQDFMSISNEGDLDLPF